MPTPTDAAVTFEHDVPADPDTVWRSLTTDEGFSSWSGEGSRIDPRPGGRVDTPDTASGRTRAGAVEHVDEHRNLRYRWWPTDDPDMVSTVDITLEPSAVGTRLVVIERRMLPTGASMQAQASIWPRRFSATRHLRPFART